ncbi:MAG: carboxymuconolactone decarboxylase family protein [Pseudomonadales bacterium]|nr:carboxymuconolactone decarboxylase family protein [Pseudomonadales bacterium]MCP5183227.1 carboxymuconolactone decarboxylase family protein [Pseudomonadales bacterium]
MRLDKPRIPALESDQWTPEAAEMMQPFTKQGRVFNIFKTLCNHPELARRWMVFANHILGKSTLTVRDRELLILRIGYLCQSGYEWGQHVLISRQAGMSEDEIRLAKTGSATPGISDKDRLLLTATEELHADAHVSDSTWAGLSEHYNTQQLMDIVFTVGQYNLVSMALNSFGVQADEGLPGWDV